MLPATLSTRPTTHHCIAQAVDKPAWVAQLKSAKKDVEALINSTHANPILVRLGWHDRCVMGDAQVEPV